MPINANAIDKIVTFDLIMRCICMFLFYLLEFYIPNAPYVFNAFKKITEPVESVLYYSGFICKRLRISYTKYGPIKSYYNILLNQCSLVYTNTYI